MNATFADIHAAADYIGPGAIEVPLYQTEIFDICRRASAFGQRIRQVPATGHPSRFFEETAIPNPGTAGFVNPRSINPTVVSPTRIELSVPLKAVVAQINNPKMGVMPNWNTRLDEATIKSVVLYVHALGGGE